MRRTLRLLPIAALLPIGLSSVAWADSTGVPTDLYRGARAQAMGNAFVSVADDDEALYYNPAGLAGNDSTSFDFVNLQAEGASGDLTSLQSDINSFEHLSSNTLNTFMGQDLYVHADYAPTLMVQHFAISFLTDQQLSLLAKNESLPDVNLGYQTTNGIQAGYGFKIAGNGRTRGELRIGVGAKLLFRRGGYYDLTQQQILNMSETELDSIIGNFGTGFGMDLGTQYLYHFSKRLTWSAGASWLNIGGISFSNNTAAPVDQNLSVGTSVNYKIGLISTTVAYDYQHITDSIDYRLRNHAGVEVSLPLFNIDAGISEIYPTFGVGVNLWLVKVMATTYAEEMSALGGVDEERRYLLQISMGL